MPLLAICQKIRFKPPQRHNADAASIFIKFASATDHCMLHFETSRKSALHRCCGVVAAQDLPLWRRALQLPRDRLMPSSFDSVTSSCFERRHPAGKYDLIFKVAFGSDAVAAKALGVSRMTVWRCRHDRAVIPKRILDDLRGRLQTRVTEAHAAQEVLNAFLALPPKPPRKLSGCCAGFNRRTKKIPTTPEEWAALG